MEKIKKKKSPDKKQVCLGCGILAGLVIIAIIVIAAIFGSGDPRFDKVKSPTNQSSIVLLASNAYKNAKIEFYQDGTKTQELKSDGNGKFSVKVDLREGDNKFKATATSEKGKTKTSKEINVVYDKTPPTLVLSQTEIKTDSDKAEISGETEKNSTLTLWVNDKEIGKTTTKDGKFKFNVKELKNGENKFVIKVTDEAGNIGEQKEVVITRVLSADELKQQADAKAKADADAAAKAKAEADAAEKARIEAEAKARANAPAEYKSALSQASSYANTMHMSKQGVYDQLVSEYGGQFSAEAAQYAIDNVISDWNANALAKAKTYQDTMHLSPAAIHDQLTSQYGEKFTQAEAAYAIQHLND